MAQAPTPDTFALVGVRVEVGDGRVIDKTTILLRHGIIAAIGPDIKVPADAEVIKGDGLTVYPGFIDGQMVSGFTLPAATPDQDKAPDTGSDAPASMRLANRKGIRPEIRAVDYLTLTDATLSPIRQAGFTTALIAPSGGSISGMSTLVNLSGAPTREAVVRPTVTMGFGFGGGARAFNFDPTQLPTTPQPQQQAPQQQRAAGTGYPGNILGYIALLRQTLYDAQYYRTVETAFAKGASVRPPTDDSLIALQPVMMGAMPAVFDADNENQIVRAMHIADEFGMKLMLGGGTDAWKLAPALAKKQIPVLLSLNFGDEPGVARAPGAGGGGRFGAGGGGRPGGGAGGAGGAGGGRRRGQGGTGTPNGTGGADLGADGLDDPTLPPAGQGGTPGGFAGRGGAGGATPTEDEDSTPKSVIAEQHQKWEEKIANAGKLQSAGVPFVFTTRGARTPSEFMDNLRKAIKAGLKREDALKALTINAAKLYHVDRQMGTVEIGKVADLVLMNGDFAEAGTRVRYVFIDKSKFDLVSPRATTQPTVPTPALDEDDDND